MAEKKKNTNFDEAGNYIGPEELELKVSRKVLQHPKDPNPIETIKLVEPTIKQMAAFESSMNKTGNSWLSGALLISLVAEIPQSASEKLSSRDYAKAMEFLTGFLPPGPEDTES